MSEKSRATQYAEERILPRLVDFPFRAIKLGSMIGYAREARWNIPRLDKLHSDLAVYHEFFAADASDADARRLFRRTSDEAEGLFIVQAHLISQATIQDDTRPMNYLPQTVEEMSDIIAVLQTEHERVVKAELDRVDVLLAAPLT